MRLLIEQSYDKLIAMKLYGVTNALNTRLERVDHQSLTKEEFFFQCSAWTECAIATAAVPGTRTMSWSASCKKIRSVS